MAAMMVCLRCGNQFEERDSSEICGKCTVSIGTMLGGGFAREAEPRTAVVTLMARDDITLVPSDLLALLKDKEDQWEHPRVFVKWLAALPPDRMTAYDAAYVLRLAKWVLR